MDQFHFKFDVGEKVRVKGKDIVGEITKATYQVNVNKYDYQKIIKYCVRENDSYYTTHWADEDKIERLNEKTNKIAAEFVDGVYDVLIDVNLKSGNYDAVKDLVEQREWEKERS